MRRSFVLFALTLPAFATAQTPKPTLVGEPKSIERYVWPDEGVRKWAPRPTVAAITANDLRTRLYQFSDDSMEGRRVGERGNFKGTAYIAAEFQRLGLKPGGDNGTYFQILDYGRSGFDSTTIALRVGGTPLTPKSDFMPTAPTATNGVAAHVSLQNLPTVFAGPAGDASVTLDPAVFRGKIAVFALPASAPAGGGGRGAGRGAGGGGPANVCDARLGWPNQRGARDALEATAAAAAARGAVPVAPGRGGAPVANAGGRGGRGGGADPRFASSGIAGVLGVDPGYAGTANYLGNPGMFPTVPAGGIASATISADAAAKIFGKPLDQLTVGSVGQPVSATWDFKSTLSPTPARNVIAILPGSDPARASEYVLVGAHNDHVGMNASGVDHDSLRAFNTVMRPQGANDQVNCRPNPTQQRLIDSLIQRARSIRPPRRDSIMNGADDDGSGSMVMVEIAEQFAKEKPARSIIFVSHQGEESGLLGSRWFVDHPTIPLENVVAAHNMDMLGKGRVTDVRFGGLTSVQTLGARRQAKDFGDIIDSVNGISKEPMAIDKTWDVTANPLNRFCRSDQVNYVRKGIPVTYFSLGYARDYHQPTDEPQYIDYEHSARLGRFIHDVMTAIANRGDRPKIDGPDPSYPSC